MHFSFAKFFTLIIFANVFFSLFGTAISARRNFILHKLNTGSTDSSFQGQIINWHYSRHIETHGPHNHRPYEKA